MTIRNCEKKTDACHHIIHRDRVKLISNGQTTSRRTVHFLDIRETIAKFAESTDEIEVEYEDMKAKTD